MCALAAMGDEAAGIPLAAMLVDLAAIPTGRRGVRWGSALRAIGSRLSLVRRVVERVPFVIAKRLTICSLQFLICSLQFPPRAHRQRSAHHPGAGSPRRQPLAEVSVQHPCASKRSGPHDRAVVLTVNTSEKTSSGNKPGGGLYPYPENRTSHIRQNCGVTPTP